MVAPCSSQVFRVVSRGHIAVADNDSTATLDRSGRTARAMRLDGGLPAQSLLVPTCISTGKAESAWYQWLESEQKPKVWKINAHGLRILRLERRNRGGTGWLNGLTSGNGLRAFFSRKLAILTKYTKHVTRPPPFITLIATGAMASAPAQDGRSDSLGSADLDVHVGTKSKDVNYEVRVGFCDPTRPGGTAGASAG